MQAEAPCGRAGRPWISVVFVGEGLSPAQRESIAADLRAGLRLRGIDVCALGAEGSEPPLALVQLGAGASSEHVSVTIDVHDAITEKRVLRDVDLSRVTVDGRSLRVSQAAEELLRASWAELALADAPTPPQTPPIEVTRAVLPAPSARMSDRVLGVRFAAQHHAAGTSLLGGDAFFTWFPTARFGAEVALGLREGMRASARNGSIDSSAVSGAISLCLAILPRTGKLDLTAKLGTQLSRVRFAGRGDAGVLGRERALFAASARGALAAQLWLTRALQLSLELGPGLPLRSVTALDSGRDAAGTSGVELHGAFGLGVSF